MLDLASAVSLKSAPGKRVVRPHEFEPRSVSKASRHIGRTDYDGENQAPQYGINSQGRTRGPARRADEAEERLYGGKIDRNDGVGDCAVRLTMDALGVSGSGAWTRQKAAPFCSSNQ